MLFRSPETEPSSESGSSFRLLDPTLKRGQIVEGRFQIQELLDDTGSMAFVYKATQLSLRRVVVLKVLRMRFGGPSERERLRARFHKELQAYADLNHPNIVTVHDSGWTEDGHPWIAMEFLEGRSLRSDMRRKRIYSQEEMLAVVGPVARALSAAHKCGIVHNDLKPENIFLLNDGTVKLVDFGTAKFFAEVDKSSGHNLGVETVIGTPAYMPAERHYVHPSANDDPRSDLYSLGIVEMEMLTGVNPITNNDRSLTRKQIASRHATAKFQQPMGASTELWAVMEPLLRADPDRRTSTAREHAEQLDRVDQNQRGPWRVQSPATHAFDSARPAQSELALLRSIRSAGLGALSGAILVASVYSVLLIRARHFENRPGLAPATSPTGSTGTTRPRELYEQQPPPTSVAAAPVVPPVARSAASGVTEPEAAAGIAPTPVAPTVVHSPVRVSASGRPQKPLQAKQSRSLEISEESPYAPGTP